MNQVFLFTLCLLGYDKKKAWKSWIYYFFFFRKEGEMQSDNGICIEWKMLSFYSDRVDDVVDSVVEGSILLNIDSMS